MIFIKLKTYTLIEIKNKLEKILIKIKSYLKNNYLFIYLIIKKSFLI